MVAPARLEMNHRLALYTFGVFIEPTDHPVNDGFTRRNDPILAAVEQAAGFVARSGYADDPGPDSWGQEVYPEFYVERGDGWSPATLSLWTDIESAMAFSYFGLHAEALSHGREWFFKPQWPPYAAWWVADGHVPDWTEAVRRHGLLHRLGSTAKAFNFKRPFGAAGRPVELDRREINRLAALNRER